MTTVSATEIHLYTRPNLAITIHYPHVDDNGQVDNKAPEDQLTVTGEELAMWAGQYAYQKKNTVSTKTKER